MSITKVSQSQIKGVGYDDISLELSAVELAIKNALGEAAFTSAAAITIADLGAMVDLLGGDMKLLVDIAADGKDIAGVGAFSGASATLSGAASAATVAASGAITGASVAVTGAATSATVAATGAITGASVAVTGAATSATVAATGAITAASVAASGAVTAASMTASGAVTAASVAAGSITASGNVTITGDLLVNGDTVTINASTLIVEDKNIVLALSASGGALDGAGFSLGTDAGTHYMQWNNLASKWNVSDGIVVAGGLEITGSGIESGASAPLTLRGMTDLLFRDSSIASPGLKLSAAGDYTAVFAGGAWGSGLSLIGALEFERAARVTDVNAEETRALGAELVLRNDLASEVSNRVTDVNAEETRAVGVEAAIRAEIVAQGIRMFSQTSAAPIAADSAFVVSGKTFSKAYACYDVYMNGQLQMSGSDFALASNNVAFKYPVVTGDILTIREH